MDAEDIRLNDEWEMWQERVQTHDDAYTRRAARRWVLVNVFGHPERYHYDPEFYAQINGAEQMLYRLEELAGHE